MNEKQLQKYIDTPLQSYGPLCRYPILLTTSKGRYLKPHKDLLEGVNLEIVSYPGGQFPTIFEWLCTDLYKRVSRYGKVVLYVWVGTCDLTCKKGKFIELRQSTDQASYAHCQFYIDKYLNYIRSNFTVQQVRLIFLEIPPYSIVEWNSFKNHPNPESFREQDKKLDTRLTAANSYINIVNDNAGVISLRFRCDILKIRKDKKGEKRYSLSFKHFTDGIHPGLLLARYWMKRLSNKLRVDCRN